jgi:hypothetical protein
MSLGMRELFIYWTDADSEHTYLIRQKKIETFL